MGFNYKNLQVSMAGGKKTTRKVIIKNGKGSPFSFKLGINRKESKMLTDIPIKADTKIDLSFDKALKT